MDGGSADGSAKPQAALAKNCGIQHSTFSIIIFSIHHLTPSPSPYLLFTLSLHKNSFQERIGQVEKASPEVLETFDNQYPDRDYTIKIVCPEFTSVCPRTGQPDFGTLVIEYIPSAKCVELKSLKLYLQQYRNMGIFYETATNQILDDLAAVLKPRKMTLTAAFNARGGITTTVTATYREG